MLRKSTGGCYPALIPNSPPRALVDVYSPGYQAGPALGGVRRSRRDAGGGLRARGPGAHGRGMGAPGLSGPRRVQPRVSLAPPSRGARGLGGPTLVFLFRSFLRQVRHVVQQDIRGDARGVGGEPGAPVRVVCGPQHPAPPPGRRGRPRLCRGGGLRHAIHLVSPCCWSRGLSAGGTDGETVCIR
jgi:hypothetical protein